MSKVSRLLALVMIVLASGCGITPEVVPVERMDLARVAEEVAQNVGVVQQTWTEGTKPPLLVFEEVHTSRIGQIEIAVMLLRLRERFNTLQVGLEGAPQGSTPLEASWFRQMGGAAGESIRQNVALRMLGEGEISSSEFMALAFDSVEVKGIENRALYEEEHDVRGDPMTGYLVSIAEKTAPQNLSQREVEEINNLLAQKKEDEAIQRIIDSDSWTREQNEFFNSAFSPDAHSPACETLEERVRGLQTKAAELSVEIDPQLKEMADAIIAFYHTCGKRSVEMVDYTAKELLVEGQGEVEIPSAMVIGAAHTEGIARLLREADVPFAVISPVALSAEVGSLTIEQFGRKNLIQWARVSNGSLGRLLNTKTGVGSPRKGRKPPPIIETATAKSYASANFAAMVIAKAARDGRKIPEDIQMSLAELPEFRTNPNSFSVDGYDVIYETTLTRTDGGQATVWTRVGSTSSAEDARSVEQKLLQMRVDLGGSGNIPPTEPPSNTTAAKDEGPGDGKRGATIVARTGPQSLAVFGASRSDVTAVGRISG